MAYSGQMYQLWSTHRVAQGAYVAINGPHDTYGVITKSELHEKGSWLNQIRGVPKRPGEKPVAEF